MIEITVCVNPDGCAGKTVLARRDEGSGFGDYNSQDLLEALEEIVGELGVGGEVALREKVCLWGCTFGPRIDVAVEGREFLYGREDYHGEISVRGNVEIRGLSGLPSLKSLITDHLP